VENGLVQTAQGVVRVFRAPQFVVFLFASIFSFSSGAVTHTVILNSCGQRLAEFQRLEPGEGPFTDDDVDKILKAAYADEIEDFDDLRPEHLYVLIQKESAHLTAVLITISNLEKNPSENADQLAELYQHHHNIGNILAALKRRYEKVSGKSVEN
jgi:hypothetical protein